MLISGFLLLLGKHFPCGALSFLRPGLLPHITSLGRPCLPTSMPSFSWHRWAGGDEGRGLRGPAEGLACGGVATLVLSRVLPGPGPPLHSFSLSLSFPYFSSLPVPSPSPALFKQTAHHLGPALENFSVGFCASPPDCESLGSRPGAGSVPESCKGLWSIWDR